MTTGVFRLASILGLVLGLAASPAAAETPAAPVQRVNAALLQVMTEAESLGYQGRVAALAPVMGAAFDFPLMARLSVGRHWKSLDKAQRERLTDLFAQLSIATFAARFDGYGGEVFRIIGEEPQLRGAVLVHNQLVKVTGEVVMINYLLRRNNDGWRIVDVLLDGKFSELALRRSQYTSLLKNQGYDGLIETMAAKVADLADSGSD
ncbi:MAG: ABC transporter substrate-binding protein [Planctomycetota bacterium]|jgi:phospholipid transport system substrate-binding protein